MPVEVNPAQASAGTELAHRVRERLDRALEELAALPEFEGMYFGPWWEGQRSPVEVMGSWKRAVLRRESVGATHWGHVYVLVGAPRGPASHQTRTPTGERGRGGELQDGGTLELEGAEVRILYRVSPRANPGSLPSLVERWRTLAQRPPNESPVEARSEAGN